MTRAGLVLTDMEARDGISPVTLDLRQDVLSAALGLLESGTAVGPVAGVEPTAESLRRALESTLRSLAAVAPTPAARVRLVDRANASRPWSTT